MKIGTWMGMALATGLLLFASSPGAETTAPAPAGPVYTHYLVDTSRPQAEVCLAFSKPLDEAKPNQYADYLQLTPELKPALRVAGRQLCLTGFSFSQEYRVEVRPGLPGVDGGRSAEPARLTVALGDRKPMVNFTGNGAYILPRHLAGGLTLETVNVEELWVTIHRLGERILAPELRDNTQLEVNSLYPYQLQNLLTKRTTPLWSGALQVQKQHNQRVSTLFPFSKVLQEALAKQQKEGQGANPGAYLVTAQNAKQRDRIPFRAEAAPTEEEEWRDYERYNQVALQWVVDTDLGLTTLRGSDGLHLLARSLATGKPQANVTLSLLAVNNDVLGQVVTDAIGQAKFAPGLLRGVGGTAPSLVTAHGPEGDFALIDLKRAAFDLSDRGVAGRPYPGPVDAFLYTERGIYRPGETVHLTALSRDQGGVAIEQQPLILVARRPNGSEFRRLTTTPQGAGAHAWSLTLPPSAARGAWSVTAHLTGQEAPLGKVGFDVQDFVPQRLKVLASSPAAVLTPGQEVTVDIDGAFLYGAPASGLKGEGEIALQPDPAPFPAYKEYRFGRHDDPFKPIDLPLNVPDTDAKGHCQASAKLTLPAEVGKPLKAVIGVRLIEPGGRVTGVTLEKPVRGAKPLIGLQPLFKGGWVKEGEAARFQAVLLAPDGKPLPHKGLTRTLIRENRTHHWYFQGGVWRTQAEIQERQLEQGLLALTADRPAAVTTPAALEWGHYRLELKDPDSGAETTLRFNVGWAGSASADSPDQAEVLADRTTYRSGDKARVHVKPPFAGPVHLAVATDRVWESYAVEAGPEGVTVEIPVKAEWGAGAYVLASAFRPLNQGRSRDPVRAVGVAWLGIDPQERALTVALQAPAQTRPRQRLAVQAEVTGAAKGEPVFLTLAAVDEGILQLTRFRAPDPLGHYFGKRRLAVELRDDYGRLLDGGVAGATRSGGDSLGGAGLPVVPTKSVALFSGLLPVGADGKVSIPLDLPDFNGQLRLMAVAHGKNKVGAGEGTVTVRHPVVGEVSLPRFLAPGDQGRLTLLVHNLEGPAGDYRVRLESGGAITLPETFDRQLPLPPEARVIETIPVTARDTTGLGTVALTLEGPDGWRLTRSWEIAVRSPHRPVTIEESAPQPAGERWQVDPKRLADLQPEGLEATVAYGLRKGFDVAGWLRSLDRYPFGCTEQLTSRLQPLLAFGDAALLANTGGAGADPNQQGRAAVQEMLNQILERQDADGAIGLYRAGDGAVNAHLAAYVVETLQRAKEKGFHISDSALANAYRWLRGRAQGREGVYGLTVLSRRGEAALSELRYFHDTQLAALKSTFTQAALGAALARSGDLARANSALQAALAGMTKWGKEPRDYYASPLRDWAALLSYALEGKQESIAAKALEGVVRHLRPAEELNTQEKAWLLRAAALMTGSEPPKISASVAGTVPSGPDAAAGADTPLTPQPGLPGQLVFKLDADTLKGASFDQQGQQESWRTLTLRGTPLHAPPPEEKGLQVSKKLFTLDGKPIDPTAVKQNDRLIVSLSGRTVEPAQRHLVLVDLLPAGWEMEGVVMRQAGGAAPYPFLKGLTPLSTREARDDRFVAAFNVGNPFEAEEDEPAEGEQKKQPRDIHAFHLAYLVRAVTPGRFFLPAPVVEDMYRPTVTVRGATGLAVVH